MARPKRPPVTLEAPPEIPESAAAHALALQNDADQRIADVLTKFGDGLPFDAARYEYAIRGHLSRSAEEMLAAGRALIVVREHLPHGEWGEFLGRLGLEMRISQRMMQAAIKFSNASVTTHLVKAAGSKTKLFELMVLDDEDLAEISGGGTVAGLTLDEVDRMSSSELRRKVRDLKAEREATQKLLDDKNRTLDTLQANLEQAIKGKPAAPPDEVGGELRKALAVAGQGAEHAVRDALTEAIRALSEHVAEHGGDATSLAAGCVMQVQQALNDVRDEFSLPAFQNYVPSWLPETAAGVSAPSNAPLADGDVRLDDLAEVPLDRA